jgi:hypothetical protein
MTSFFKKRYLRSALALCGVSVCVGLLWLSSTGARHSSGTAASTAETAARAAETATRASSPGLPPEPRAAGANAAGAMPSGGARSAGAGPAAPVATTTAPGASATTAAAGGASDATQGTPQASGPVMEDEALSQLDQMEVFAAASVGVIDSFGDIRSESDQQRLTRQLKELEDRQEAQLSRKAAALNVPEYVKRADGQYEKLMGFDGDTPLYAGAENVESAISIATAYIRQSPDFDSVFGAGLDGSGFIAAIYEPALTHQHDEFMLPDGSSRLIVRQTGSESYHSNHAEHVAGTIGAEGKNPLVKGMAPAATLYTWIYETSSKITGDGMPYPRDTNRVVVTSSSYGISGSAASLNGRYGADDQARDTYANLLPYTMMFCSLGNSGATTLVDGPFETITGYNKENKNHIGMGNTYEVTRDAEGRVTGDIVIYPTSSRGPTDDGRIAPFLVANGANVLSTVDGGSAVAVKTGTSMASPAGAGSTLILQQYFSKRFPGHLMRNDTVKALLAHTADDAGHPGPDYTFGYGLLNALKAGKLIKAYADQPASRRMVSANLQQGVTHVYALEWDGVSPLRTTISWIDPVGPAIMDDDDRTSVLVNDLDVTVVAPSGAVHRAWAQPYVLNGFQKADIDVPAVRADNNRDNTEVVDVDAPVETGVYEIRVAHKGVLQNGEQSYTLVHSGFVAPAAAPVPVITGWTDLSDGWYRIEGSGFLLGAQASLMRGGEVVIAGEHLQVTDSRLVCRFPFPPSGLSQLVVVNPDAQSADVEISVQPNGIVLTSDEATWTYSQNFDTLTTDTATAQTWINDAPADTTNGLLGWYAGNFNPDGTAKAGAMEIRADNGTTVAGRLYSYGSTGATDRAFGTYRLDAAIAYGGTMRQGLRVINRSGRTLTGFDLQFWGEQWRYGAGGTRNATNVSYAIFATGEGTLLDRDGIYTPLTTFEAPRYTGGYASLNGNSSSYRTLVSESVAGLNWAPGQELWICWSTQNYPNYDDGLAIDDLVFTANADTPPTPFEAFIAGYGLAGANTAIDAAPAGDGVSNLLKFALGGSPLVSDPSVLPAGAVAGNAADAVFTLTFPLRHAMTWDPEEQTLTGQGVVLLLEQSADLAIWEPAALTPADPAYQEGRVELPAGEIVFKETALLSDRNRIFYRLRAQIE